MTHPGDQPGDQPHDERDPRLAELLSDAVSDIEPANRLDAIRNETKVTSMSSRRPWLYAVGGAVVATAAVITAIAAAGGTLPGQGDDDPAPAAQSDTATEEPTPTTDASEPTPTETSAPPSASVVPVYFAGDTPSGPRLYREFLRNTDGADPLVYAAATSVAGSSDDPDYGTLWPSGVSVTDVTSDGADILTVGIAGAPHDLPSGMTQEEAQLAAAAGRLQRAGRERPGPGRRPVPPRRAAVRPDPRTADVRAAGQRPGPQDPLPRLAVLARRGRDRQRRQPPGRGRGQLASRRT